MLSVGQKPLDPLSCTAMLYYDVQAAFYRALRQVVAPFHESDDAYVGLMHSLGLPAKALEELSMKLSQLSELERGGATPHLVAIASSMFKGTWFRLDTYSTAPFLLTEGRGQEMQLLTCCLRFRFLHTCIATSVPCEKLVCTRPCLRLHNSLLCVITAPCLLSTLPAGLTT